MFTLTEIYFSLILAYHLRYWPNIKTIPVQNLLFFSVVMLYAPQSCYVIYPQLSYIVQVIHCHTFHKDILDTVRRYEHEADQEDSPNMYLNDELSYDEVEKAVRTLQNGKSPGLDNIPNEILKNKEVIMCLKFGTCMTRVYL